ncbi:Collagenase [Pseudolycoriella hygida]|uniref:Collagenase n=1 Tax=Pseudolycoriella hygida TaxID=35572 RepID=A0A9Q0RY90_9DIPT|nr:Collagenase [Pseudolycoriella hygida]
MNKSKVVPAIFLLMLTFSNVKTSPVSRIIDGTIANQHQFPWQASLHITTPTLTRYCGGSLISRDFVLTAAWCLRDALSVRIDMGSIIFLQPAVTLTSTQFIKHPQYNDVFNANNIGIIRLPTPVGDFSNTLRAILIPGPSHAGESYINTASLISGYGVHELGSNVLSNYLRYAPQTTITNEECQQSFDSNFVQATSICARSSTTQAACFGDMGGPLVVQYQDTWMQIGIASTLQSTGCQGTVVYTRLTSYIEWIRAMTGISNDS